MGDEFGGCGQTSEQAVGALETLSTEVDAVIDPLDPVPFLVLHYLQIPVQLLRIVRSGTPWLKLDLCSGKVVELGGD